jgi:translation initiation factor IF-1
MGALHFLDIGLLPDALRPETSHQLEVFEMGGELFVKVTLAAPTGSDQAYCEDGTPYTASICASMRLTPAQMASVERALAEARARLAY